MTPTAANLTPDERRELAVGMHAHLTSSMRYWWRSTVRGKGAISVSDCDYLVSAYAPLAESRVQYYGGLLKGEHGSGHIDEVAKSLSRHHPDSKYGLSILAILGSVLLQMAIKWLIERLLERRADA